MRHVPISIFAIVAIVGIMTLLLSVSLIPGPVFLAVQYVPTQYAQPPGGNTVIVRLEVNEFLANEITALSEAQLAGLRGGEVHAKEVSSSYTQSLRFGESGLFSGCQVVFLRTERNEVSDILQCSDAVFKYQVEFSPGLRSDVEGGKLPDIEDEDIELLGDRFTIVDTDIDTGSNSVSLKLFGGFGSIEIEDNNYVDDSFQDGGLEVNGEHVDGSVKIKVSESGNSATIFSIQILANANAKYGGSVQVLPLHCLREYMQYPTALLVPNFDICYKGLGAAAVAVQKPVSGNEVRVKPRGDDEYTMYAPNVYGTVYPIPLAQVPAMYGNNGRDFIFVEAGAPGAPNIDIDDYFLVTSKDDVQGDSRVLRYKRFEGGVAYFEDIASGAQLQATTSGSPPEGDLLAGQGTYHFVVGAGNSLAMDQTNNGAISGNEARYRLIGGSRIDFGPGFTITITTPSKLFDEPAGDENTDFDITFGGGQVDLVVPTPQTTVPGYTFNMVSSSGGIRQGLTKYGILFTWDQESESDELTLIIPGAPASIARGGAGAEIFITLERDRWMKKPETGVPAPTAKCGDRIITKPEYCDPPGSFCAGTKPFERGVCANDCMSCVITPPSMCGNNLLEKGEECETAGDCPAGFGCSECKCQPPPAPVCGNNLLESGEQCEKAVDCGPGYNCINCFCSLIPPVEVPAPVEKPNFVVRFFLWLAHIFGWSG